MYYETDISTKIPDLKYRIQWKRIEDHWYVRYTWFPCEGIPWLKRPSIEKWAHTLLSPTRDATRVDSFSCP